MQNQPPRTYKAIFFDLDGTLLPIDIDPFLERYFARLHAFAARRPVDTDAFVQAIAKSVSAMAKPHDANLTNAEVFWRAFWRLYAPGQCEGVAEEQISSSDFQPEVAALVDEFYEGEFGELGKDVVLDPAAARAVNTLHAKGYPLYLTTMPLFPRRAVEWRVEWAGIDPSVFARITTYDNSYAAKPSLDYFRQNIEIAGVPAEQILMVGNHTREDMAACELGCDGYLVTDHLLNPEDADITQFRRGTLADFAAWVEQLPDWQA